MIGSHLEPELAHVRPARSVTVILMSLLEDTGPDSPSSWIGLCLIALAQQAARQRAAGDEQLGESLVHVLIPDQEFAVARPVFFCGVHRGLAKELADEGAADAFGAAHDV